MLLTSLFTNPVSVLLFLGAVVVAITVHEFSHAAMAFAQGDTTAKRQGRLTLNPLAHLDPLGSIAFLLAGFGWGKPVPYNPYALRNRRAGEMLVGLAGPLANLALAVLAAALLVRLHPATLVAGRLGERFLWFLFQVNVLLAVFNLLPLPPLDGSRLLTGLLPPERSAVVRFLNEYGLYILLALVFLGGLKFVGPLSRALQGLILKLVAAG